MNKTYTLKLLFICLLVLGCNKNKSFYDLKLQKSKLKAVYERNTVFGFGNCFLYSHQGEKYILIVNSNIEDDYIDFFPVNVSDLYEINEETIRTVLVTFHSRKPYFLDYVFAAEIPYGVFNISFDKMDKEAFYSLQKQLKYLFTINLDRTKVKTYGGTTFNANLSLYETVKESLDFENRQISTESSLYIKVPLENLCK